MTGWVADAHPDFVRIIETPPRGPQPELYGRGKLINSDVHSQPGSRWNRHQSKALDRISYFAVINITVDY